MTDTAELIARLKYEAANCDWVRPVLAGMLRWAADALSSLVRERDELRAKWIDADEDAKVQKEFLAVVDARITIAEAERDEAREAAYDQPHGPTSRMLWSTRYGELLDDYKDLQAENEKMRKALTALVAKLDLVHADARYEAAWMISQLHGKPYSGPTYIVELTAARAALSNTSEGGADE